MPVFLKNRFCCDIMTLYIFITERKTEMKRTVSLILAIALVFSLAVPAFAAKSGKAAQAKYDGYPVVVVRGMEFNGLTYKAGTPEEQNCLGEIKAGEIIKTLFRAIGKGVVRRSWDAATDEICDYLLGVMGLMACDEKGRSKYDVSVQQYTRSLASYPDFEYGNGNEMGILKAAAERYGAKNVYYYNYDWRLDPFGHAEGINKLVNTAIRETGKKKVNLVCCSMGGIETVAYLYKYGYSKLNRVMFMSSTAFGTHVTTDVMRGMIELKPYNVYSFARQKLAADNRPLALLFDLLYKGKVFDAVCGLVERLIPHLKARVYEKFLTPVFGTVPAVWALVLPEGYKEAVEYMFGNDRAKYTDFIKLTEKYQTMASKRDSILKKAQSSGVSVCFVASYNSACVPVYPGGGCNGDSVLEADRMLGGAKVATLGTNLGDNYKPKKAGLLSPDKVVDLSGVLSPDTTWAICGSPHVSCSYGTDYSDFLFWALGYKGNLNVRSSEKYPQFMMSSHKEDLRPF